MKCVPICNYCKSKDVDILDDGSFGICYNCSFSKTPNGKILLVWGPPIWTCNYCDRSEGVLVEYDESDKHFHLSYCPKDCHLICRWCGLRGDHETSSREMCIARLRSLAKKQLKAHG